jgi:hypothetical protein
MLVASLRRALPGWFLPLTIVVAAGFWGLGMWRRAVWQFGTVGDWLDALADQAAAADRVGFAVSDVIDVFFGARSAVGDLGSAPAWFAAVSLMLLTLIPPILRRRDIDWAVVALGGFGGAAYFAWLALYPFALTGDKYLTWLVPFVAVGLAGLWSRSDRRSPGTVWPVVVLGSVLACSGIVASQRLSDMLVPRLDTGEQVALTINALAENEPCLGFARYNTPALQVGSGCSFRLLTSDEAVVDWITSTDGDDLPRFAHWPGSPEDLGVEGWDSVVTEGGRFHLWIEASR